MADFGQGVALYFFFLKYMAMLMAFLSISALPNMIWSAIGRQGSSSGQTGDHSALGGPHCCMLQHLHGRCLLCDPRVGLAGC